MHTIITGPPGVGKSTLIRRILAELNVPVSGFQTKKEPPSDNEAGCPVYLYPCSGEPILLGFSNHRLLSVFSEAFDHYAPELRRAPAQGRIILLDELGTMESRSPAFCSAVLELLDGDTPVIAAAKHKDTPFLNAVRTHPKSRCFHITEENREALFPEVLDFVNRQISSP